MVKSTWGGGSRCNWTLEQFSHHIYLARWKKYCSGDESCKYYTSKPNFTTYFKLTTRTTLLHFMSLKNVEKRFLHESCAFHAFVWGSKEALPGKFQSGCAGAENICACLIKDRLWAEWTSHVSCLSWQMLVLLLLLFISVSSSVVLLPPTGLFLSPHLSQLCSDMRKFAEFQNLRIYRNPSGVFTWMCTMKQDQVALWEL